jgi:CubicO group peptidase (beta-lactamase class C family)
MIRPEAIMSMMKTFPPKAAMQVTLANWRTAPFNKWAFHHVREIVPSADIANDPDAITALPTALEDLSNLGATDEAGRTLDLDGVLQATDTDALVILKGGRIIYESYANGMERGTPHILMSVSKSMLGLLAGILVDRGVLELERQVTDIIPELKPTAYAGAAVRDLLDMRVGIDFDEDYLATSGPIIAYRKATNWNPLGPGEAESDLRAFYAELTESDGPHGGRFHYVSPNTDLLAWIIERSAGTRYADLMSELLWRPLGASRPAYVTVDRLGAPRAAGGRCATARDLALVGRMVAGEGAIEGRQIVPAAWIADITGAGDPEAWNAGDFAPLFPGVPMHYRAKWYIERPGPSGGALLFGLGVHGQHLYVDAARDLVIAKFSSQALPLDEKSIALTARMVAAVRAGV